MQNRIKEAMKRLGIDTWLIRDEKTESTELFFIRRKLDLRRICATELYTVTVYRDFEVDGKAMRGSSETILSPDMDDAELAQKLQDAWAGAEHVQNPAFALYHGAAEPEQAAEAAMSIRDAATAMTKAMFDADCREDAFLNSAELFLVKKHVHICSSEGTDAAYTKAEYTGEFVVQCLEPQDVEQYLDFRYDTPDAEALKQKISDALERVCDRAKAVRAPASGSYDLILSGQQLRTILDLYLDRANANMVYPGYSEYQPGTKVQGEVVHGAALNLTLVPDAPYSSEGIPMKERALTENGVLQQIYGTTRFCRYLGMEPTGSYSKVRLGAGTVPFEQLKQGCLWPVTFSDFQMDSMSGYFGGEIRLAYLFHEDGTAEILTGGSVSGSLLEKQDNLVFSTETYADASYEGPFAVRLSGVTVAG